MSPVLLRAAWLLFIVGCYFFAGYQEKYNATD
jgi:hypothetical protein